MSKITDMAKAEADQVEAETPDEPETDEPETDAPAVAPDSEPVEQPPPDEAAFRKAERAIAAHRRKIGSLIGEANVEHECFVCRGTGHLPTLPPLGTKLVVVESEGSVSFDIEPGDALEVLRDDETKRECERCGGWGELRAPTKVPHARVVVCTNCTGQGWIQTSAVANANVTPPPPVMVGDANGANVDVVMPDDAWGRPWGHEFYGRDPASIPADPAMVG